jgi:hypothetical protein
MQLNQAPDDDDEDYPDLASESDLEETPPPQAPTETRNSFWSGAKVLETTTIFGQMRLEKFLRSMQL